MAVKNQSGPLKLDWPLMQNNITAADRRAVIRFLERDPRLTQSEQVAAFEAEWSAWLGVKHSVFVNSGSSANLITLAALKEILGLGEVLVPALTWVSDITAVLQHGFRPVFVDINPRTLGMDEDAIREKITARTKAVFLTHILGFNGLTPSLVEFLKQRGIALIEDACESHGARMGAGRVGSFGWLSNFSFYYAHHMSTVEGGMVCTNDPQAYQILRMLRSHGLVREATSESLRGSYQKRWQDLNPQFIFAFPAYNVRSTEINAVLGRHQLKRLDREIEARNRRHEFFLKRLDSGRYRTDFEINGCSNYALVLILQKDFKHRVDKVMQAMDELGVEYRRGTSGGGNQLRQPYLKRIMGEEYKNYPETEHVHFYGFYLGNYPTLPLWKIEKLCDVLNRVD